MASPHRNRSWMTLLFIAGLAVLSGVAQAQTGTGTIVGTVRGPTGEGLSNVAVSVAGTNLAAHTDQSGMYRIGPVPAGDHTVVYTYIGLGAATATVKVTAGQTVTSDVKLTYSEAIQVSGAPILEGQAKALNTQENAVNITNVVASDQIGRFADRNAAEATQRLPAISLLRDQGEGRYILVRGTEPRLNSTTINGERLPSPEADVRNVALDTIPVELLESIEVAKALTPDMDGDAIGGTVDLVTKRAPLEAQTLATIGGGYAAIAKDYLGLANLTLGRRFSEGRTGFLMSVSGNRANRGSDNFEPTYDEGDLDELQLRDYTLTRDRYGLTFSLDQQLSSGSEIFLRGLWDEYKDSEIRRAFRNRVSDERLERVVRDRDQKSRILSLTGGGNQLVGETVINYRVAWNKSRENTPNQLTTTFRQKSVSFDPNVSADSIDPDNIQANPLNENLGKYKLNAMETQYKLAEEEDWVGSIDVTRGFYRDSSFSGLWKFGLKGRMKTKTSDYEVFEYSPEEDVLLTDYLSTWKPDTTFIDGRYTMGPFPDPGKLRALLASGTLSGERVLEEDLADHTIDENSLAAYAMTSMEFGSNVTLLAGVRGERTNTKFKAFELIYDADGNPSDLTPVSGKKDFTQVLPMVHLKARVAEHSNLRAAVTRTFARPNFIDIAPYQLINDEDEEIRRGNPNLKYTTAWNFDLLFEHYLPSVGIVSAGAFYKQLKDNIFVSISDETINGTEYEVEQPINAESGWLRGLEVAYQTRFASLPKPFDGLGLYFNYSYADSKSSYPTRADTRLQGQAEHVGNLALSYEKAGFSGRVSLNYNGNAIFAVGDEPATDQYVDDHMQLDLSVQQKLTNKLALMLELINLTNEPYRVYEGTSNRPLQEEYYRSWGTLSLRMTF